MVDDVLTEASQRYEPESPANARFDLLVVEGPNAGKTFALDGAEPGPSLLGQSEACTFRLEDREVSRRHAELDVEDAPREEEPGTALARAERTMRDVLHARLPFPVARLRMLEALQKAYVERALAEHDGSVERAAAALGVGRRYFHILKTGKRKR